MPELQSTLRWPDGSTQRRCSPSWSVRAYLAAGEACPLANLVGRSRTALVTAMGFEA